MSLHRRTGLALLLLLPGAAVADGSALDRARAYVATANDLFEKGQYGVACNTFREAYDLIPGEERAVAILFNAAQSCRRQYALDGDVSWLGRAREYYARHMSARSSYTRVEEARRAVEDIDRILATRPAEPEAPPLTQILVTSRTPGALARVDGGAPAEVPYPATVDPGEHVIEVEAPGFHEQTSKIVAVEGRLVVMPMDLEAIPARLAVTAPEAARIFVDGVHLGVAPLPGPATVDAGEHILTVTSPGYRASVQRFEVERGGALDLGVKEMEYTDQRVAARWLFGGAAGAALAGAITAVVAVVNENGAIAEDPTRIDSAFNTIGPCPDDGTPCGSLDGYNGALSTRNDFRTASIALFSSAGVLGVAGLMLYVLDTPEVPAPPVTVRAFGVSAPGAAPGPGDP